VVAVAALDPGLRPYLRATAFIDALHPRVQAYALKHSRGADTPRDAAVQLFYAIRDGFAYDPYALDFDPANIPASTFLLRERGYCIEKANLLAACCRALGIPSRLGFGDVRNHLGTDKLERVLGTNLMVFHGYAEVYLDERWVKATPAFNAGLCQKLGVQPLEWDGREDAVFQEASPDGRRFMSYERDRGVYADWPLQEMIAALHEAYGHLFDEHRNKPLAHLKPSSGSGT
jgi:transglutaminase-like putative cysteine protease